MQGVAAYNNNGNKWVLPLIGSLLFFACIAMYEYTDNYYFIPLPFVFLYVALMGVNWKAAYWIFLFFIPCSIELNFNHDASQISLPDEPITWLFLIQFIVMWAAKPNLIPKWWWKNPLVLVVVAQFIWTAVTVIFSKVLFFSFKFLIAKTWYLVVFLILPIWVFTDKKDFAKAFVLMLVPMVITMVIIMIRHRALGFGFRKIEKAIGGLYYNHVEYSTVMSMFFPLLLVALPLTNKKNPIIRLTLAGLIAFFLVAIFLTYARAAMIAVVFAIVVGLAIRLKLVNFIMPAIYGLIAVALVYLGTNNKYFDFRPDYRNTFMHKTFTDHMIATFRGKDMSSMERLYRWVAAFRMSKDRPILGYGPHAFYYYYKPYAVSFFRTYVSRNPEHSTTHNYFIYMLVEQGWPAMLLYALLVMVFFAHAQKVFHRFTDRYYRWVTLGVAMMFAAGFINNFFSELLETHKVGALFYLSIALLIFLDKKSRDLQKEAAEATPVARP